MPTIDTTPLGLKKFHPNNNPRTDDVASQRANMDLIDELIRGLEDRLAKKTATQLTTFVPVAGDAVINTTTRDIHIGDGVTPGGFGGKGLFQRGKDYADTRPLNASSVSRPILMPYISRSITPTVEEYAGDDTIGAGIADAAPAINAGLVESSDLILSEGRTYRTLSALVLPYRGSQLASRTPVGYNAPTILADFLGGPAIHVKHGQSYLAGFTLTAGPNRYGNYNNSPNHGILLGGVGAGSMTGALLERLIVTRQPGDAIHSNKGGANQVFNQVWSQYNRGHGFFFDDGTYDGLTIERQGIVNMTSCRSNGDGGNAIRLSPNGETCYRFVINNLEAFDNAWNLGLDDYSNYILDMRIQNFSIANCAYGDLAYNATLLSNGDARAVKSVAAGSIRLRTASKIYFEKNSRHIGTTTALVAENDIEGINVNDSYNSNPSQALGYKIGTGCTGVKIRVSNPSMYTRVLESDSAGGKLIIVDREQVIMAGTAGQHFSKDFETSYTIASGTAQLRSSSVNLAGEGGVADDLSSFTFSGGGTHPPTDQRITVFNGNAYAITVKHGTGNIFTKTGADVVLGQNRAMTFLVKGSNYYEC